MNSDNYVVSINGGGRQLVDLEQLIGVVHNYADEFVNEDSGVTVIKVWHADSDAPFGSDSDMPALPEIPMFEYMQLSLSDLSEPGGLLNINRINSLGGQGWEIIQTTPVILFKRQITKKHPPCYRQRYPKEN